MALEKCIFIQTHSDESEKVKQLLIKNKASFITFVQNSNDSPILIAPSSVPNYEGYKEILEYVNTLPYPN